MRAIAVHSSAARGPLLCTNAETETRGGYGVSFGDTAGVLNEGGRTWKSFWISRKKLGAQNTVMASEGYRETGKREEAKYLLNYFVQPTAVAAHSLILNRHELGFSSVNLVCFLVFQPKGICSH